MSVFACLDEEKMNHISNDAENCVRENYWNSSNPSMVSFVGLESNNQKQFWGWETNPNPVTPSTTSHANPFINPTTGIFDCNTLSSSSSTFAGNPIPYFQFSDSASTCLLKKEDDTYGIDGGNYAAGVRIGLNLGHRTYFSSRDTAVIDRLFRRPRGFYQTNQVPRCQAESCGIDLSYAKHYHRRHKVCEFHSKAIKVVAGGLEQRFCQQCSRFHVLAEFDEAKRSCRKRLADHNRRRRKPQLSSSDSVPTKIAENGVSVPVRTVENAFSQMGSSVPVSELKVTSLASSTLPLMTAKSTIDNMASTHTTDSTCVEGTVTTLFANGPALSLGGEQHQITATHHRPIIFNNTMALFQRQNSVSAYHNLMISSSNDASLSAAGGSDQTQHPEHLQNLLHLGQAMFEVELL